jgi:hypothetical protein
LPQAAKSEVCRPTVTGSRDITSAAVVVRVSACAPGARTALLSNLTNWVVTAKVPSLVVPA